jgi:hypothetical protein
MIFQCVFIVTILLFGLLLQRRPSLLLRPSVWFVIGLLIRVNAAAAFADESVFEVLENPALFRLLILVFPIGVLVWVFVTPNINGLTARLAREAESRYSPGIEMSRYELQILKILILISVATLVIYFLHVPLKSTGIYVMLTDPLNAVMAREESLKLLSSPLVRYSYVWHFSILAPVIGGLVIQMRFRILSWQNLFRVGFLILLVLSVMLSGARTPGGLLLMLFGVVGLLRVGIRRGTALLVVSVIALLGLATFLTIIREDRLHEVDFQMMVKYFSEGLFHRVFVMPMETGVWTNALAQDQGLFGFTNIRPLAVLFGEPYVNMANVVGLNYVLNPYVTVSAVTCYIFDYQGSFGYWVGWLVSLILLCSLDYFLFCFSKLKGRLLVALLGSYLVANLSLVSATFTTFLLTHGTVPIAMIALIVGSRLRPKPSSELIRVEKEQLGGNS